MPLMSLVVDWTWLRKKVSELEDISIETSRTEKRKKTENRTEYPRTVGKLQKM